MCDTKSIVRYLYVTYCLIVALNIEILEISYRDTGDNNCSTTLLDECYSYCKWDNRCYYPHNDGTMMAIITAFTSIYIGLTSIWVCLRTFKHMWPHSLFIVGFIITMHIGNSSRYVFTKWPYYLSVSYLCILILFSTFHYRVEMESWYPNFKEKEVEIEDDSEAPSQSTISHIIITPSEVKEV